MSDDLIPEEPENLSAEPLSRAIGERYLTYALSTIMNRALPDAIRAAAPNAAILPKPFRAETLIDMIEGLVDADA